MSVKGLEPNPFSLEIKNKNVMTPDFDQTLHICMIAMNFVVK